MATGQLRGFKIGNQRRFKGEEILHFIEQQDGEREPQPTVPTVQADRLYSLRDVASILQVPMNEAAHLLREGRLPGFRVGMEWRCWGRDLMKLAPSVALQAPANLEQPPLSAEVGALPTAPLRGESSDQDKPIETAA
jgi:hypothetical protein